MTKGNEDSTESDRGLMDKRDVDLLKRIYGVFQSFGVIPKSSGNDMPRKLTTKEFLQQYSKQDITVGLNDNCEEDLDSAVVTDADLEDDDDGGEILSLLIEMDEETESRARSGMSRKRKRKIMVRLEDGSVAYAEPLE